MRIKSGPPLGFVAFTLGSFSQGAAAAPAPPPTITVQSVTPNAPDLGTIVYSSTGTTVFTIAPATGAVSSSGSAIRVTSGNASTVLVTLTCTGGANSTQCPGTSKKVTITKTGTPSGFAGALTNFTIAPGPNPPIIGAVTGTKSISFNVSGIPENGTGDFYVGMDFPVGTSGTTGSAISGFSVAVANGNSLTGLAIAKVIRPISIKESSPLSFGMVARPRSGSGSVTLDPSNGNVTVLGTGAGSFASPAASRAAYTVTGEGAQTFSISVPSFTLSGPAGASLTVTPSTYPSGQATLGGVVGASGTTSVYVGGSFAISDTTTLGNYTGTLTVTVQYN